MAKLVGGISPGWRWAIIPALAVAVVPIVGLATGGAGGAAVMAALADPLSVLAGRSPGSRAAGALFQTKKNKVVPGERVLAKELTRPIDRLAEPGPGAIAPVPGDAEPAPEAAFQTESVGGPVTDPGTSAGYFPGGGVVVAPGTSIASVGGGGGSGGGGGGGGGSTSDTPPPTTTPTTTPTPVPSVPEPATWVSLMIGFGAVGGALRWKRRTSAAVGKTARTAQA